MKDIIKQNGHITVTEAVSLGLGDRHKCRRALESLVERGEAKKIKNGNTVTYVTAEALPENGVIVEETVVQRVVSAMRTRKALSPQMLVRRTGLPAKLVNAAIAVALHTGRAERPFKRTARVRRI